jgi:DivIVA domain-containing protein
MSSEQAGDVVSRPGQLSAADVRSVVFDEAKRLSRGYNEEQVDEFLDLVADAIEDLAGKLAEKQAEVNRLKHWRESQDPLLRTGVETQADLDRIMSDANRNAEAIVRRAQAVAERIEEESRARAVHILDDAQQRAELMLPASLDSEEIAVAALEVGTRIGGIRDALSNELANLYRLIGRVQNGDLGR